MKSWTIIFPNFWEVSSQPVFDTGNPLLDAVVTAKHTDAPQISFDVSIPPLTNQIGIDAMDIAMLLATALDNAIEGCEGCQDPFIRVKIVQQGRTLSILVQNPTNHPIREKKNRLITQKADSAQHGYGISGYAANCQQIPGIPQLVLARWGVFAASAHAGFGESQRIEGRIL